jgi:hypothetical protein
MIGCGGAGLQRGVLKAADHKSGPPRRQWANARRESWFLSHFLVVLTAAASLMVLATAFVAAQSLFDANGGLLDAVISVRSHTLGFQ